MEENLEILVGRKRKMKDFRHGNQRTSENLQENVVMDFAITNNFYNFAAPEKKMRVEN